MSDSPFFLRIHTTHLPIPVVPASRLASLRTNAGKPSGALIQVQSSLSHAPYSLRKPAPTASTLLIRN